MLNLHLTIDGIAWDWINEKLYWNDVCKDTIEVFDPATGYRRVLLYTGTSSNNRDIVVDPTTGQVMGQRSSSGIILFL